MKEDRRKLVRMIPNMITAVRLLGVVMLLFAEPLSTPFTVIYTVCGVSDVIDGFAARMLRCTSEFGAKLDSVSDMMFYLMMLIRVFPVLFDLLPKWIWIAVGVIILVRVISYALGAFKYRRFASLHTYMNKLTGALVFLVPYAIIIHIIVPYGIAVCAVALLASAEELIIHITSAEYKPRKSLFID